MTIKLPLIWDGKELRKSKDFPKEIPANSKEFLEIKLGGVPADVIAKAYFSRSWDAKGIYDQTFENGSLIIDEYITTLPEDVSEYYDYEVSVSVTFFDGETIRGNTNPIVMKLSANNYTNETENTPDLPPSQYEKLLSDVIDSIVSDPELDTNSSNPVQNKAVSKAIYDLDDRADSLHETVVGIGGTVGSLTNRVSELNAETQRINNTVIELGQRFDEKVGVIEDELEDLNIISPLRLDLSEDYGTSWVDVVPTIENGYFKKQSNGTISTTTLSSFSAVFISNVKAGEVYHMKNDIKPSGAWPNEGANLLNYFVFARTEDGTEAAVPDASVKNYVKRIDDENFIYEITIPENCTVFYTATYKAQASGIVFEKKVEGDSPKLPIDWLVVKKENLDESILDDLNKNTADAILYTEQTLTEEQKAQARVNIGAVDSEYVEDKTTNISPLQLNLNEDYSEVSWVDTVPTIEQGYFKKQSGGVISKTTIATLSAVFISGLQAGEVYYMKNDIKPSGAYPNEGANLLNYFVFAKSVDSTEAAVPDASVKNYVKRIDDENYIYELTIPENCTAFYTATYNAQASGVTFSKKVGGSGSNSKLPIGWLVVEKENLSQEILDELNGSDPSATNNLEYMLMDSLPGRPFDLEGKTLLAFGDSITAGYINGSSTTENGYIKLFADKHNMTLVNKARAGTCIAGTGSGTIAWTILQTSDQADVITVAGGTNDYGQGQPLGQYGDTTRDTFYGSLYRICEYFKTNYPQAEVIFITPLCRIAPAANFAHEMDAYRTAIYQVATSYGYNVVNGKEMGMPSVSSAFSTAVMKDGTHPTEAGHALFANNLHGKLA